MRSFLPKNTPDQDTLMYHCAKAILDWHNVLAFDSQKCYLMAQNYWNYILNLFENPVGEDIFNNDYTDIVAFFLRNSLNKDIQIEVGLEQANGIFQWAANEKFSFDPTINTNLSGLIGGNNVPQTLGQAAEIIVDIIEMQRLDTKSLNSLSQPKLEQKIQEWIIRSKDKFYAVVASSLIDNSPSSIATPDRFEFYVLKYFPSAYLETFLKGRQRYKLFISKTHGFTWGEGIYVSPLRYPYTGSIYGRSGVMGGYTVDNNTVIYDAKDPYGIALYQAWIRRFKTQYDQLTTTVSADDANQELRNLFRRTFKIDLVFFSPDQFSSNYVSTNDVWIALTDWVGNAKGFSDVVKDCRWVAVIEEDFKETKRKMYYDSFFGKYTYIQPPVNIPMIISEFKQSYSTHMIKKPIRKTITALRTLK